MLYVLTYTQLLMVFNPIPIPNSFSYPFTMFKTYNDNNHNKYKSSCIILVICHHLRIIIVFSRQFFFHFFLFPSISYLFLTIQGGDTISTKYNSWHFIRMIYNEWKKNEKFHISKIVNEPKMSSIRLTIFFASLFFTFFRFIIEENKMLNNEDDRDDDDEDFWTELTILCIRWTRKIEKLHQEKCVSVWENQQNKGNCNFFY